MCRKVSRMMAVAWIITIILLVAGCTSEEKKAETASDPVAAVDQTQASEVEVTEATQAATEASSDQSDSEARMEALAKEEGISVKEMASMVDTLTQWTAEKYGRTKEAYEQTLKDQGQTPFEAVELVVMNMGMSVTDYYTYEKANMSQMTDEQKEIMEGMGNALEMAQGMEIVDPEGMSAEKLLGVETNQSGDINIVKGDLETLMTFAQGEVTQDYRDTYSISLEYVATASIEEVVAHYETLLLNTEGYIQIKDPSGSGSMFQGTIDGTTVYVSITNENNTTLVASYADLTTKE